MVPGRGDRKPQLAIPTKPPKSAPSSSGIEEMQRREIHGNDLN